MDGDRTGLALHLHSLPGQLIELLPLHFQGGVHGRDLEDLAPERLQGLLQLLPASLDGPLLQHSPGGILGIGDNT